jgi:hypothetical protein
LLQVRETREAVRGPPYDWTVMDSGAVLTPGPGCTPVDAHTVRCSAHASAISEPVRSRARVELGDGDDQLGIGDDAGRELPLPGGRVRADGGAGDDRLQGFTSSAGRFFGGGGDDVLVAASTGEHRLHGGPADDVSQGAGEHGLLDGGGGRDRSTGPGATTT